MVRSSIVFAGITIAAVSGASGWIGGVLVTRAQIVAMVEQLPAGPVAGSVSIPDASGLGPEAYLMPRTCLARYR